jgi:hypothetical protein
MSLLKYSINRVSEYENKYKCKFKNKVSVDVLRSIYASKSYPSTVSYPIESSSNIILYYSLLNMFNYNFWSSGGENYSRSKRLNEIFDKYVKENIFLLLNDRINFLNNLKIYLRNNGEFKNIDLYIEDINSMMVINTDSFLTELSSLTFNLYHLNRLNKKDFIKKYNKMFKQYVLFLKKYFVSYGFDKFQKREKLAWNLISESFELNLRILSKNKKCFIPIDYRIPSILKHLGIMILPKRFDKYFINKEMLSQEDEIALRSFTFITLQKVKKELSALNLDMADLQLDNKLFNMYSEYRDIYGESHFKYHTTAY